MRSITALGFAALLVVGGILAPACSPSSPVEGTGGNIGTTDSSTHTGGSGAGTGSTDTGAGICLLHNCNSDMECGTCDGGRTHCLLSEHRCVACDGAGASGCPTGYACSSFGQCVPEGKTCPTDAGGTPMITCANSGDCVACDPAHQVCDSASGKCVSCTENDTSECQSTDLCLEGQCAPKCPKTCHTDNDCGQCGTPAAPAHACNAHVCAQCSETYACPAGQVCTENGTCQVRCGLQGPVEGTCDSDADCAGCGGGATNCYTPINGGHGTCGPEAPGCSDLGNGTITLPSPFDKVTNTCSNDNDCANVAITYNVGKLLRDLTGFDEINDANISYGMGTCAAVSISSSISCGICVPCKVDADCEPLGIDTLAGDLFGSIGSIAAALLLDQIFGPNDHKIHMYCQGVAAGYGVCAPCPGILNDCTTGGGGMTGSCTHDACTPGDKLGTNCGTCEANVCAVDSYCCDTAWDQTCVNEADQYCTGVCSGGGSCHDVCTAGAAMSTTCESCVAQVCAQDAFCCQTSWDSQCIAEVTSICGQSCP